MPLKFLFNTLGNDDSISLQEFISLVDGSTSRVGGNSPYWKADLINSGLFQENSGRLCYTGKYRRFVEEIKTFCPDRLLTDDDWQAIRDNPLIDSSSFKNSIREIFENIIQQQNIEEQITDGIYTAPIVDVISEQEELHIPQIDILSTDTRFTQSTRRIRIATWSIRIKKKYNHLFAVPMCDVNGKIFVEAAHIKPDSVPDGGTPHRTHILNGLCLCRLCHVAFEKGYFSLTDDHRIITSFKLNEIPDQNIKTVILSSRNQQIRNRIDNRLPLVEFIQFHRTNRFKK
jgi:predicted restriction endonuclease